MSYVSKNEYTALKYLLQLKVDFFSCAYMLYATIVYYTAVCCILADYWWMDIVNIVME